MTRAKENLVLCQSASNTNPFSPSIYSDATIRIKLPPSIERPETLNWRFISLSLADVDLGFAGRCPARHPVHGAIDQLEFGEALELSKDGRGLELRTQHSKIVVGRLAKQFTLPAGQVVTVTVDALVRRYKQQSAPQFASAYHSDRWWVVLATITMK